MKQLKGNFILPSVATEKSFDASYCSDNPPPVVISAFADGRYAGNPAAVAFYDRFPKASECLDLAKRLRQPVTAFLRPLRESGHYQIRWFTQNVELDLCGHATLAATYWLFHCGLNETDRVVYHSRSGPLYAWLEDDIVKLSLPAIEMSPANSADYEAVQRCMGVRAKEIWKAYDDYVVVVDGEAIVLDFQPDIERIRQIECRGIALSSAVDPIGALQEFDIVSRFFSPRIAINEDEVCVSAHCKLYPYWAKVTGKKHLRALQASHRGGVLELGSLDGRVIVGGQAKLAQKDA